jgi:DNA-binding MarR family transcriptional regulator
MERNERYLESDWEIPAPCRSFSPVQSDLSYWLGYAEAHVAGCFAQELHDCGVSASELLTLRELYERGPLSPTEIAWAIGMTKGGVSKLIVRLTKKLLLTKKDSEFDRRFRTIEITKKGALLVWRSVIFSDEAERKIRRKLPKKVHRDLISALQRIATTVRGGQRYVTFPFRLCRSPRLSSMLRAPPAIARDIDRGIGDGLMREILAASGGPC